LEPGQDRRVRAVAEVVADLAVVQLRVRSHSLVLPLRSRGGARDRRGDVGAMTEVVAIGCVGEVLLDPDDLGPEVWVRDVDSRVENRYRDALAGVPGLPGG